LKGEPVDIATTIRLVKKNAKTLGRPLPEDAIQEWRDKVNGGECAPEVEVYLRAFTGFELGDGTTVDLSGSMRQGSFAHSFGIYDVDDRWEAMPTCDMPSGTAVFFLSHDPPIILMGYRSLSGFIHDLVQAGGEEFDARTRRRIHAAYANPWKPMTQEAIDRDREVKQFQDELSGGRFELFDLRDAAAVDQGFSVLHSDYRVPCPMRKMGSSLVFAVQLMPPLLDRLKTKFGWAGR
jgi:hypothetical protein